MSAEFEKEWEEFKAKFNKSYKDEEEEKLRRKLFVENKAKIEAHNERFKNGEVSYCMAINAFAADTPEEHAHRCGKGQKS